MTRRLASLLRRARYDDRPLVVRARENPELFGAFYEELYEQVLGFFAREVLDPEVAYDLMSETFAAAFEALDGFRGSTSDESYAWLWTIARRKLYRWREIGRVERVAMTRLGIEPLLLADVEFERVEQLADLSDRRADVAGALECLSANEHAAISMRVVEERPYEEIASTLGISE